MDRAFPPFFDVTRTFADPRIPDLGREVEQRFAACLPGDGADLAGKSVAVCVGSRGIDQLPRLVEAALDALRRRGIRPFLVPAMGSHGNATAQGQVEILARLGVTGEGLGVPVASDMEVAKLYAFPHGPTVWFSRAALRADYVMPVCRVKQHTMVTGDVQSGLCKMITIGCGKHIGAKEYHRHDIGKVLVKSAEAVARSVRFLCGVAVVENSLDHLCEVRVVRPEAFVATDRELLRIARSYFPRVPLDALDALIVNEIGKDISGGGADVNVIGAWRRDGGERTPDYAVLAVLGISKASHGNAVGLGCMDIMPKRLLGEIDYPAMFVNVLTSGTFRSARTPLWVEDDAALLRAILGVLPEDAPAAMARIRNTRDLDRFWVTKGAIPRLAPDSGCVVDAEGQTPAFDERGVWLPFV